MKIESKVKKFQMGGAMPQDPAMTATDDAAMAPAQGAPEGGSGDPMEQILQLAAQAVQTEDCTAAIAACNGLIQLVSQMQGGPQQSAPQEEPTFARKGAKLTRVR